LTTETETSNYYWPRDEITIVEAVSPVEIEEAVFVRDKWTGNVKIEKGPTRLLLDPRSEEILKERPVQHTIQNGEIARLSKPDGTIQYVSGEATFWAEHEQMVSTLQLHSRIEIGPMTFELKDGQAVRFTTKMMCALNGDDPSPWFACTNEDIRDVAVAKIQDRLLEVTSIEFDQEPNKIVSKAVLGDQQTILLEPHQILLSDVEVLQIEYMDPVVHKRLRELRFTQTHMRIEEEMAAATFTTKIREQEREAELLARADRLAEQKDAIVAAQQRRKFSIEEEKLRQQADQQDMLDTLNEREIERQRTSEELSVWRKREARKIETEALDARINGQARLFESFQPQLVAALDAHGHRIQFAEVAKHLGPSALLQNTEVTEMFKRLVTGSALEQTILPPPDKPNGEGKRKPAAPTK